MQVVRIEDLLVVDRIVQVDRDNTALAVAEDDVRQTRDQCESSLLTELAGADAVDDRRRTTALDVPENRDARVELRLLRDVLANLLAAAGTLCHDDENVALALLVGFRHVVADLIEVVLLFRHEDVLRAARDARDESEPAAVAAHDLEDDDAAMGRSRIAQLVDRIDDRIRSRIAADRVVRAPDIVIDRARQADDRDARLLREQRSAAQGAVTADDAETLDAAVRQVLVAHHAAFRRLPAFAACRAEERTTALDDITDVPGLHLKHILFQQTVIAAADAPYLDTLVQSRADDSASCRVHAWAVAAARQDCNTFQHNGSPP